MSNTDAVQWSQVVAKGAGLKVITPSRPSPISSMSTDLFYEHPDFTKQLLSRKAAAIVRQALTPDSVLFSFPMTLFTRRSQAYKIIESQIGPVEGFRPLSAYDVRTRRDLLIEAKFVDPSHATLAIENGIIVDDVVYNAAPSVAGAENPLIRVQLNLLHISKDSSLLKGLLSSLRYYGQVYQIRRVLCDGYFEGQLTITIDPSVGYKDMKGEIHKAQPLQRMLYLETWDIFAPATFKGAAPVCYYCRQAGHIRNKCPELAKRICFECGEAGHTRKFCKTVVTETQAIERYTSAQEKKKDQECSETMGSDKQLSREEEIVRSPTPQEQHDRSDKDEDEDELSMDTQHAQGDEDMPMEEDRVVNEKATPQHSESYDPDFNINSSKWAPYDRATRMKIDEVDDMEDEVHLPKVTLAQRSTLSGKRSILKSKGYQTSPNRANSSDLKLRPVFPPLQQDTAQQGQ